MANYGLEGKGVAVLHRTDFNFIDVAENLSDTIQWLASTGQSTRLLMSQSAQNTASEALGVILSIIIEKLTIWLCAVLLKSRSLSYLKM